MASFNWEFDFDKNFPLHVFSYSPKIEDELHWHDYYEIGVCLHGSGKYHCLDKTFPIEKGDVFVANNFENHVAHPSGKSNLSFIFLIFLPDLLQAQTTSGVEKTLLSVFNYDPRYFQNRILSKTEGATKLVQLMKEMLHTYNMHEEFRHVKLDLLTRKVLLELNLHYSSGELIQNIDHAMDSRIEESQKFIIDNLARKLKLAEVAQHVGLSSSYFRHLFRDETKLSYQEYLTKVRLAHAIRLLISTKHSILTIIEMSGFGNASQFYRLFKRETTISPAEFRQRFDQKYAKNKLG